MKTPAEVLNVLEKLDASDKGIVLDYIESLHSQLNGGDDDDDEPMDHEQEKAGPTTASSSSHNNEPPFPPVYESSGPDDFEKAGDLKQEAADLASSGDWEGALDKYTAAVLAAPPSALLYANRANVLLKLDRPLAAERDCDLALKENPDSAKALRTRGKARKALFKWEDALHDLSAAQQIDFDENVVQDLKELTDKRIEQEKAEAAERNEERDRLRKKAEDIKKAQEEAKKEAAAAARTAASAGSSSSARGMPGGMPFGGMPGGGGMGGGGMPPGAEGLMGALMSDPELMAAMQNPKVQNAFQELMSGPGGPMGLMSNPAKLQELMGDPEVGPVLQKLMAKLGGAGMGGMPGGGMGGMPGVGMGGMPGGGMGGAANDDIPDLDDMPDLE